MPPELLAVIDLDVDVKVQQQMGVPRFSKMSLAWPSDLQTLYVLRFDCRVGNKFVTLCVTPSRSVLPPPLTKQSTNVFGSL